MAPECAEKLELLLSRVTGNSVWPMVELAGADGHDTRVGFEDGVTPPNGTRAENGTQIITAAMRPLN